MLSLAISELVVDLNIQPRANGLDQDHADGMAEYLRANPKNDLPAVVVYRDPATGDHVLSEGFHRAEAYARAGRTHLPADVRDGDRLAAVANAMASNQAHGLKRTNADKRRAAEQMVRLFPDWSNRRIADHIGVGDDLIADVRPKPTASESDTGNKQKLERRTGKDGKTRPAKGSRQKAQLSDSDSSNQATGEYSAQKSNSDSTTQTPEPETEQPDTPKQAATVIPPTAAADGWGIPVQPHAAGAFAAVPRFAELRKAIAHAQKLFNEVANAPGGEFLRQPAVSSYRRGAKLDDGGHADRFVHEGLETALRDVKNATPTHTVCPYTFADAPHAGEKCRTCLGLNWTPVLSGTIPAVCVTRAKAAHGVTEAA